MRKNLLAIAAAGACLASPAGAGFGIPVEVKSVGRSQPDGPIFLLLKRGAGQKAESGKAMLRITCEAGRVASAAFGRKSKGKAARAGSGDAQAMAGTPKRWRSATAQLRAMRPVLADGALSAAAAPNRWTAVGLANSEGLCAAAEQALR